jgi:hypothetical protein
MVYLAIGLSVYDNTEQYLEEYDARQHFLMATDFQRETGEVLRFGDALRTDAEQEIIFRARYTPGHRSGVYWAGTYWQKKPGVPTAAAPGRSNHRLGKAVDYYMTAKLRAWLPVNGPKYGFTNVEGKASGEDWHWVRAISPVRVAAFIVTSITPQINTHNKEEESMFIVAKGPTWGNIPNNCMVEMAPDGKLRMLSGEEQGLVRVREAAGLLAVSEWKPSDIYNHEIKSGLWEYTGAMKETGFDPGYSTGYLLFGLPKTDGSDNMRRLPGEAYPAR